MSGLVCFLTLHQFPIFKSTSQFLKTHNKMGNCVGAKEETFEEEVGEITTAGERNLAT
jgi:hypothetical protein